MDSLKTKITLKNGPNFWNFENLAYGGPIKLEISNSEDLLSIWVKSYSISGKKFHFLCDNLYIFKIQPILVQKRGKKWVKIHWIPTKKYHCLWCTLYIPDLGQKRKEIDKKSGDF